MRRVWLLEKARELHMPDEPKLPKRPSLRRAAVNSKLPEEEALEDALQDEQGHTYLNREIVRCEVVELPEPVRTENA